MMQLQIQRCWWLEGERWSFDQAAGSFVVVGASKWRRDRRVAAVCLEKAESWGQFLA